MQWESLGPSHFKPVEEGPDYFFVEVPFLRESLARMGARIEMHGDASVLIVDDRPCDPVYLPKPVRGFLGYPSIEKLVRNSPIDIVDLCQVMRAIVKERNELQRATPPREQDEGEAAT